MENTLSYSAYLKSPYKSIKHSTYFNVYDALFSRYIGKKITFVEIGILSGGSLFMWREFFGPEARIIGIDLNPAAKKWENYGFEIFIGSQSDTEFWLNFCKEVGEIDIVLDDGGHTYLQQITTCEMLLSAIKENGLIVVEDTHTSYMNGFGSRSYSFIKYACSVVDAINYRSWKIGARGLNRPIWSVQFFESIVAIHINSKLAKLTSCSTSNNGEDDSAVDFRHSQNRLFMLFSHLSSHFTFLKMIPGTRSIAKFLRLIISNQTGSSKQLKEYFNSIRVSNGR